MGSCWKPHASDLTCYSLLWGESRVLDVSFHPQHPLFPLLSLSPWHQLSFNIQAKSAPNPLQQAGRNINSTQDFFSFSEVYLSRVTAISYLVFPEFANQGHLDFYCCFLKKSSSWYWPRQRIQPLPINVLMYFPVSLTWKTIFLQEVGDDGKVFLHSTA